MSNYIFNDSLNGIKNQDGEAVSQKKKTLPIVLIVCISLAATSIIVSTYVLAIFAITRRINNDTPRVTHSTSYVSNGDQATLSDENNSENIFDSLEKSVVSVSTRTGASGSGVIAGEFYDSSNKRGYYIVTTADVISNHRSGLPALLADVTCENGDEYEAVLCGSDNASGIAVLKIYENETRLPCVKWANPEAPQPSGFVIIGNAGGGVFNLNGELVGISNGNKVEEINYIPAPIAFEAYLRLTELQYQRKLN